MTNRNESTDRPAPTAAADETMDGKTPERAEGVPSERYRRILLMTSAMDNWMDEFQLQINLAKPSINGATVHCLAIDVSFDADAKPTFVAILHVRRLIPIDVPRIARWFEALGAVDIRVTEVLCEFDGSQDNSHRVFYVHFKDSKLAASLSKPIQTSFFRSIST